MNALDAGAIAQRILFEEARALDEQRFDDWLALYARDAIFWVPAWTDEGRLTSDPETELSLIHCTRAQLAERVGRVEGGRSMASSPLPRTAHIVSNLIVEAASDDRMTVRSVATTHAFNIKRRATTTAFALVTHELGREGDAWLIARKTIALQNDYISTMMDFYTV
ncbi:MAG: aromatic-ring-hydroxylating dioxygenase subunit beta [Beijerinckiaceae bacterium]|nr:aromatic-ring-hydroxylating dioxygenase subunit beta [Beijerinckiaceae bacterium]